MKFLNGSCLKLSTYLKPNSIGLVFCGLPYGQTCCKWDNKIELNELWTQFKRVIKPTTPLFFTCSTKFGYELIKSNEKWFRYDLVWEKSARCGFLTAKKMPMRKHEMIYVFYEKLPLYDISNHKHKFIGVHEIRKAGVGSPYGDCKVDAIIHNYEPPLPTSVLPLKSEKGNIKHKSNQL